MGTKIFDFKDFSCVEIRNAMELVATKGDTYSVSLNANDDIVESVKVSVENGCLLARFEARWGHLGFLFKPSPTMPKLSVVMPELKQLDIFAASRAKINGFESGRVEMSVRGASRVTGDLKCQKLKIEASAASKVELSGSADEADIESSGASNIDFSQFMVQDAEVEASAASQVVINVNGKLDAKVSGASHVQWLGNPTLGDIRATGASSFNKK